MENEKLLRATAFHEAAHAVLVVALEHRIDFMRIDARSATRQHGTTESTLANAKGEPFLFEESAIINAIGGLAETKHDAAWKPHGGYRDDDLNWIREKLRNRGVDAGQIEAFLEPSDQACSRLLEDPDLWAAINRLTSWIEEKVPPGPLRRFLGPEVEEAVTRVSSRENRERWAAEIRRIAPSLYAAPLKI